MKIIVLMLVVLNALFALANQEKNADSQTGEEVITGCPLASNKSKKKKKIVAPKGDQQKEQSAQANVAK